MYIAINLPRQRNLSKKFYYRETMSIEVHQLVKSYSGQRAVNAISFSAKKGEIVGFLGPNGAGKSTTMKMITGYLSPDSGQAFICGMDVKEQPVEVKHRIGYLPESNSLYYDLFVKEYLDFVGSVYNIKSRREKIEQVIDQVGLRPECHKQIGQLSKGYKQRVGLAAALLHDPEVLVLDEPTSGLDPNQIVEIREVIKQLGKDKTVLLSTHIMQEVEAICDRVVIINKGEIVADDKLSNLSQTSSTHHKLKITFEEALEPAWLQRLPAADTVDKLHTYSWQIATQHPDQLRKQLMELALEHQLNIVQLQQAGRSLEETFRALTEDKGA